MRSGNIFLIGPMGAGKTTIGRQLAKTLGYPFYDSDKEVEARTGVDIPLIFEYEGEAGFRKRERAMISELSRLQPVVLATGGGAILDPDNRQDLAANGFVVYLKCTIDRLLERTRRDCKRPLLNTTDPKRRLEEIVRVRDPLYESVADCIVDTGRYSSTVAVKEILRFFNRQHSESCK